MWKGFQRHLGENKKVHSRYKVNWSDVRAWEGYGGEWRGRGSRPRLTFHVDWCVYFLRNFWINFETFSLQPLVARFVKVLEVRLDVTIFVINMLSVYMVMAPVFKSYRGTVWYYASHCKRKVWYVFIIYINRINR